MAGTHRDRIKVAHPHAPIGTCKHCGAGCAPHRRTHDRCREQQAEANDYRAAAVAREGQHQRCVDCGYVDGQERRIPGTRDYEVVVVQRDHPHELTDNGPRWWTVPRCVPCHKAKTKRAAVERKQRQEKRMSKSKGPDPTTLGGIVVGGGLVLVALVMMGAEVPVSPDAAPTTQAVADGVRWVVRGLAAVAVVLIVGVIYRWHAARRHRAIVRVVDDVAALMRADPTLIRMHHIRWTHGRPTKATLRYPGAKFDDKPGSRGRNDVEEFLTHRVGMPLRFGWNPPKYTLTWGPTGEHAVPAAEDTIPGVVVESPVRERVEQAIGTVVRGNVHVDWGRSDTVGPLTFTMGYPSTFADESPEQRLAVVEKVNAKAPGRWRAQWDTEQNVARFTRRPDMPSLVPAPVPDAADRSTWSIPFGVDESGAPVVWDLKAAPHCLIVGATGSGKTVTLRSVITDASARGMTVFGLDPKRIELTGFRGWPGVRYVASSIEDMIALIEALADEMDDRYARIEAHQVTEDELAPILVVLDEYTEFVARANAWWKRHRPKGATGTEHPVIERHRSMARLGRSGRVHLVTGTQRPDAKVFGGEARDNYRFRVALGSMSEQGARMVFGRADVGRDIPDTAKGRATVVLGEDGAVEVQTYSTPNPRSTDRADQVHLGALADVARARGRSAVEHISPAAIAARVEEMLAASPVAQTRPALPSSTPVEKPVERWEVVDADDLAQGLIEDAEQWIEVDVDGHVRVGLVVSVAGGDDGGDVEVEYQRQDGTPGYLLVGSDETFRRRA